MHVPNFVPRDNSQCSLALAMSDVQNFFLEALAVIFVKAQYLYFRRKLSVSSIRWYQFSVAQSMYAEVTLILIFPIQTFIEQKCKRAPLVLH